MKVFTQCTSHYFFGRGDGETIVVTTTEAFIKRVGRTEGGEAMAIPPIACSISLVEARGTSSEAIFGGIGSPKSSCLSLLGGEVR